MTQPAAAVTSQKKTRYAVTRLTLQAFRNYDYLTLEVPSQSIVLTGHNGAGKTNILEALSLLVPGRGMRRSPLNELDRHGSAEAWSLSAAVEYGDEITHIGTGRDAQSEAERRLVQVDGTRLSSQNQLARHMAAVWLTPQMDSLFRDSAGSRRRFIDRLAYSFDAEHATRVNAYEKTMRERNKLLSERGADPAWLQVLEQQLAEQAVAIAHARNTVVSRLNSMIDIADTPFPKADIAIDGTIESALADGQPASAVETLLQERLYDSRRQDSYAGRTSHGIHRSDLLVTHRSKAMPAGLCSTGEQKALLLNIVLAHAAARGEWEGCVPLLLLDEVVAHLDETRRNALSETLQALGVQAWMTGTDAADFSAFMHSCASYQVESGAVSPLGG